MDKKGWKATAFVFICLFVSLVGLGAWGYIDEVNYEKKINSCYYEVCDTYPEAVLDGNVCFCYEYDNLGYLIESKTEVMD